MLYSTKPCVGTEGDRKVYTVGKESDRRQMALEN